MKVILVAGGVHFHNRRKSASGSHIVALQGSEDVEVSSAACQGVVVIDIRNTRRRIDGHTVGRKYFVGSFDEPRFDLIRIQIGLRLQKVGDSSANDTSGHTRSAEHPIGA